MLSFLSLVAGRREATAENWGMAGHLLPGILAKAAGTGRLIRTALASHAFKQGDRLGNS